MDKLEALILAKHGIKRTPGQMLNGTISPAPEAEEKPKRPAAAQAKPAN